MKFPLGDISGEMCLIFASSRYYSDFF